MADSHAAVPRVAAWRDRGDELAWLFAAMFVIVALLNFRSGGLQPVVLSDEYTYSIASRLLPLSASTIPGYLYLAVYRATDYCGDGYLGCARALNALFFVAAAPFVYAVARRVSSRAAASVIALATFAGPISSYTAYYMPEAPYFFAFWAFSWQVLRTRGDAAVRAWALAGVLFGLAALVKPHALLCLPAVLAYVLCVCRGSEDRWTWRPLACAATLGACAIVTKLALGAALAGDAGLTLFGSLYGSIARDSTSGLRHFADIVERAGGNAGAQLLAMIVLFAVPIACTVQALYAAARARSALDATARTALYGLVVLVDLVAVTALFSASTANAARLHMRYYNFAFPLLLVVVASPAAFASRAWGGRARGILASLLALAILAAAITRFRGFRPNLVDCPELAGLLVDSLTFEAVCASGIVALALWAWAPRAGARAYLFACVPLIAAAGTFHINAALRNRLAPDVYDRAGTFAKQYLRETERPKVLVVGSNAGEAYRALFHLDSPPAAIRVIAEGTSFDLAQMPAGKEWALVVGDHALVGQPLFALDRDGYRLVHAAATLAIDFRQAAWPGIIAAVSGLSQAEPWGRWSSADIVTLTFVAPLPPRFTLHLRGRALGPNVGAGIVARVGDSAATFALAAAIEDRELVLDNPERANTLSISVPHPVVPKDVGIGEDSRRLGVGLVELRVVPR